MASQSANVNVMVEPDIKEQAETILERLGISTSTFINMTYRQVILKRGIPFSVELPAVVRTRDEMTDEEFDEMMKTGLDQAKVGESVPYSRGFERLLQGF